MVNENIENNIEKPIGFEEIAATARVVNSKDRTMKLKDCINFELKELMQKVNEYNKSGKLQINIDIGIGEKSELDIQAEVITKKPKGKKPSNTYYRDNKGEIYLDKAEQIHIVSTKEYREMRGIENVR